MIIVRIVGWLLFAWFVLGITAIVGFALLWAVIALAGS